ncbi:unnamed protein product [Microthlaspi erraticum]|uniref:F-box domain-containing protein n=1 Tax=Microthlaspi erraticum TaxID=1685480 RepID=A0A6D2J0D9_9BRAS|nr:unnamed protein product [Microthlaspi erraticum]
MDRISELPDELVVKILSFLPTKVRASTSVLSKRWEFLWMWVPKLEFVVTHFRPDLPLRDFINKNLPLLRVPKIESFRLKCFSTTFQPEDINQWVAITLSRRIRLLDIWQWSLNRTDNLAVLSPSSLYTCKSLVTLKLNGKKILVDVPPTVSLPSLKTLVLKEVTYGNEDCLGLLISNCPVLEGFFIHRDGEDNLKGMVFTSPSLLRLTLTLHGGRCSDSDEHVIVTPCLKYIKVCRYVERFSSLVTHMPRVEEACIVVEEQMEKVFESFACLKRLSLVVWRNNREEFPDGFFSNQLEHLKLCIDFDYWSKLLFKLLQDSPKLRVLKLYVDRDRRSTEYTPVSWSSVPECLLESLETFEFAGYSARPEERDFVSFIIKNARRLKSSSIKPPVVETWDD